MQTCPINSRSILPAGQSRPRPRALRNRDRGEAVRPATRSSTGFASAQYSYRSSYFVEENNISSRPVAGQQISWGKVPGYGLLDARIGTEDVSGWELALYARNLTDKDYVVSYGREFLGALIEYRGEPMSWGAEARVRF